MQFAYFMTRHVDGNGDGNGAKVLHIHPVGGAVRAVGTLLKQWSRPLKMMMYPHDENDDDDDSGAQGGVA